MDNVEDLGRTFDLFWVDGAAVEARAIGQRVVGAFFRDRAQFVEVAGKISDNAKVRGVYATLNPVDPRLLERSGWGGNLTTDADITIRRWMLIDFDPEREDKKSSSTDAEKALAFGLAKQVKAFLIETLKWPTESIVTADSGNGYHILVSVDLPAKTDIVENILAVLDLKFSDSAVKIDTTVANPARITKLYGTMARKGEDSPDRPHRRSKLITVPTIWKPVPTALLSQFAALAPKPERERRSPGEKVLDIEERIARYGLVVVRVKLRDNRCVYEIICPWNPEHDNGCAYVAQFDNGALDAGCHHDSCSWRWRELREKFEPGCYDEPRHESGTGPREAYKGSTSQGGSPDTQSDAPPEIGWEDPQPVKGELLPVPAVTAEILPESISGFVQNIADRFCCPLAFPAIGAITVLATAIGTRILIIPKTDDDWEVVVNLWALLIGPSGDQKSPIMAKVRAPLERAQRDSREQYNNEIDEHRRLETKKKAELKAYERKLTNYYASDKADKQEPEEPEPLTAAPTLPRLVIGDITMEKVAIVLSENPGGVMLSRDEVAWWLFMLEEDNRSKDKAFWLETWNGYGEYPVDRVGREDLLLDSLCVSILGGTTPEMFTAYLRKTILRGRSDGMVPRLQLTVWPDPEPWDPQKSKTKVAKEKENQFYLLLKKILTLDPKAPRRMNFTTAAQQIFDEWHDGIEKRLRDPALDSTMRSHLSKYRSLYPSFAGVFQVAIDVSATEVDEIALNYAATLCALLEAHALRVYHAVSEPEIMGAQTISKRLSGVPNPFSVRDVQRLNLAGLRSSDDVQASINRLIRLHWLHEEEYFTGNNNRRFRYWKNPKIEQSGSSA